MAASESRGRSRNAANSPRRRVGRSLRSTSTTPVGLLVKSASAARPRPHPLSTLRCAAGQRCSNSASGFGRSLKWVKVPASAISWAACRKLSQATRASVPPTLIRRTPSAAASATVMNGVWISRFTRLGATVRPPVRTRTVEQPRRRWSPRSTVPRSRSPQHASRLRRLALGRPRNRPRSPHHPSQEI